MKTDGGAAIAYPTNVMYQYVIIHVHSPSVSNINVRYVGNVNDCN